jgi:hypothetical protein
MDWIHLAQDSDQRRALVNTVMNLRVRQNVGEIVDYLRWFGGFVFIDGIG